MTDILPKIEMDTPLWLWAEDVPFLGRVARDAMMVKVYAYAANYEQRMERAKRRRRAGLRRFWRTHKIVVRPR